MERLFFAPCDRYNEFSRQRHRRDCNDGVDVDLIGDIEDVYAAGFTFSDVIIYMRRGRKRVWISQRAFCTCQYAFERAIGFKSVRFQAGECHSIDIRVCAPEGDDFASACNIGFRLFATSREALQILIDETISAPDLARLLQNSQVLKCLELEELTLDEDHCRALAAASRPGLEIKLFACTITEAGARFFIESLRLNRGPTQLCHCNIDHATLAEALRGNRSVTTFVLRSLKKHEMDLVARALQEDRGVVELDLSYSCRMEPNTLGVLCQSLHTHPSLEVLELPEISVRGPVSTEDHWMNRIVEILQVNTVACSNDFCRWSGSGSCW
jgi:hypothetical protein